MNLIDVNNADIPPNIDTVSVLPESEYPYCLLGFQIKNLYDQKRIKIKPSYGSQDVIHMLPTSKLLPLFFKGIKIKLKPEFRPLLDYFNMVNVSLYKDVDLQSYKNFLRKYDLSCDECFSFLQKGVYPIDSKHINKLTGEHVDLNNLYQDAFDLETVPAFQAISYFNIFILCNKSIFKH